jgi:hypothetical protein
MKKIILVGNKGEVMIDVGDFNKVNHFKWYLMPSHKTNYAYTKIGKKTVYMTDIIMKKGVGQEVDHLNHNGLDNRKSNLRVVSHQENLSNYGDNVKNISGCPGVYWYKSGNKFRAQVQRMGKNIHLGYFKDYLEACNVAMKARWIVR